MAAPSRPEDFFPSCSFFPLSTGSIGGLEGRGKVRVHCHLCRHEEGLGGKGRAPGKVPFIWILQSELHKEQRWFTGEGPLRKKPPLWAHWFPSTSPHRQPGPNHHSWPPETLCPRAVSLLHPSQGFKEILLGTRKLQLIPNPDPIPILSQ